MIKMTIRPKALWWECVTVRLTAPSQRKTQQQHLLKEEECFQSTHTVSIVALYCRLIMSLHLIQRYFVLFGLP